MITLKFGGTSMGSASNIRLCGQIIVAQKINQIIVCSAMTKVTDTLLSAANLAEKQDPSYLDGIVKIKDQHLNACRELLSPNVQSSTLSLVLATINELESLLHAVFALAELTPKTKDQIAAFGEVLSSHILSAYLTELKFPHLRLDARKIIQTDGNYGNAKADLQETKKRYDQLVNWDGYATLLLPGFIAQYDNQFTTTLGRGGSDYSAAIMAFVSQSQELQIWTDVNGMLTADPRLCSAAQSIQDVSYTEAMELSHFGAKVIYPPTLLPVMHANIPVVIKNTFEPEHPGTRITSQGSNNQTMACGISSLSSIALIQLEGSGMVGIPGFSSRLFGTLAQQAINVILITQGSSEHSICVAIHEQDAKRACNQINQHFEHEISRLAVNPAVPESGLSIVALVGDHMKNHAGVSGKFFSALGKNGINIRAIAQGSSERNISAVIQTQDVEKAINVAHEAFFENIRKVVHVLLVGIGNVGSKLMDQFEQQIPFLQEQLQLHIKIIGLATSRQAWLDEQGINLIQWRENLAKQPQLGMDEISNWLIEKNLRNTIFVDVTANKEITQFYAPLLRKSISVVACNKNAASAPFSEYIQLKKLATEFNTRFLFETNVGASLPIIATLNDLRNSGDEIESIQAVLSGTLNFVFNNYDANRPFADVVKQAQLEGYTEPDPRLDLNGSDVMRKLLILAREAGIPAEMNQITCNGFLPEACLQGDVKAFYTSLLTHETHFATLFAKANQNHCRLKFVASLKDQKLQVGLQEIPAHSDLYHLYGKDNIVIIHSRRYRDQPLVIKGAGAGADVTAAGIFADIIRASTK